MIAVDASVLVAHLSPNDLHHAAATDLLVNSVPRTFLVHPVTLAEVLVGGVRIGKGTEMRADVLALGVQVTGRDDDEPLRLAQLRVATGLRLPDRCVLDAALTTASSLATFDRALAAAARGRGVVLVASAGTAGKILSDVVTDTRAACP